MNLVGRVSDKEVSTAIRYLDPDDGIHKVGGNGMAGPSSKWQFHSDCFVFSVGTLFGIAAWILVQAIFHILH